MSKPDSGHARIIVAVSAANLVGDGRYENADVSIKKICVAERDTRRGDKVFCLVN